MITKGSKPSNFKEWLWSAKVLTTIVWILFPLAYITVVSLTYILATGLPYPAFDIEDMSLEKLFFPLGVTVEALEFFSFPIHVIVVPPIPFMAVLFLFSLYPAIYPTEKFFKKRGNENAVIEYRRIRKILFAFLLTLVVIIIMLYFLYPFSIGYIKYQMGQGVPVNEIAFQGGFSYLLILTECLYIYAFALPVVSISILIKLVLEHARMQFMFYYAKSCFEIMAKTKNETDEAGYLSLGLDWYNKFVKRVTNGGIDIETIFSKVVSHAQLRLSDNILLDTIVESFDEEDKLKPMRHMLTLLSGWKEGGGSLIKQSLRAKIKGSSDLLIPIVTVIITIISTFFLKSPK